MAKSRRQGTSSAELPVAPLSRLGVGRAAQSSSGAKPAVRRKPGGMWEVVRGKLLYPLILAGLSVAARIVSRKKDELR